MKNRGKLIKKKSRLFVHQILNVLPTGRYICPLIKIPVAVEFNKFELQIRASRVFSSTSSVLFQQSFSKLHT